MSLIAINIESLEYFYRHQWTGLKSRALHPFSLSVQAGDCFGFLGNNGAGKTTTIKSILSLIRPHKGKISIFGIDAQDPASRQSLGYVAEQPYFYDYLSVQEIVEMYAGLAAVPYKQRKKIASAAISRLGIQDKAKMPMRSLSKGLTQRVAIAQAICHKPRLLILDEPFSGLDPIGRKEIRDLFAELRDSGTTIFICSHILSDVESLCNKASIMVKGKLQGIFDLTDRSQFAAKGFEVTFSPETQLDQRIIKDLGGTQINHPGSVRLRFENRQSAEQAIKKGFEHGLTLEQFEAAQASLEDLYISLVSQQQGEQA